MSNKSIERAIYMLRVVKKFIDENEIAAECISGWDDAVCDGHCLADDCQDAADMLESYTTSIQTEQEALPKWLTEPSRAGDK
jgi:hypothetical protein